jgi:hypothetical protein
MGAPFLDGWLCGRPRSVRQVEASWTGGIQQEAMKGNKLDRINRMKRK